jgi:hypothetical protein
MASVSPGNPMASVSPSGPCITPEQTNMLIKAFNEKRDAEINLAKAFNKMFNLSLRNGERFVFKDSIIPYDILGMPSGHSESSFFSTTYVFLVLRKTNILFLYLITSLITMHQRVHFNHHTVPQVIVGAIVGILFAYFMYYISQQTIKGKITEKPDDDAPFNSL